MLRLSSILLLSFFYSISAAMASSDSRHKRPILCSVQCNNETCQQKQELCFCTTKCSSRWKPVCGSNKKTYRNICQLYKDNCLSQDNISQLHRGLCREDHELGMAEVTLLSQLSLWDRDSDDDDDDAKDAENAHVQADVCDQAELQQSLNTLKLKLYKRKFYKRTRKSVLHTLWLHFKRADLDKNEKLSPEELIFYLGALSEQKICLEEIFKKIGKKGTELTFLELYNALQK